MVEECHSRQMWASVFAVANSSKDRKAHNRTDMTRMAILTTAGRITGRLAGSNEASYLLGLRMCLAMEREWQTPAKSDEWRRIRQKARSRAFACEL